MKFDKARLIRSAFTSFFFAVIYAIGLSIVDGFSGGTFVKVTLLLTVIFIVVLNIVDFILRFFKNYKRK
ncbi:MAG: hypothetical protein RR840_10825 [Clostridium sp.]